METASRKKIDSFLRVNHAGESAAVRLYEGQLAVLSKSKSAEDLRHMLLQEQKHKEKFETALREHDVSPSLLNPVWHKVSYGLGVFTALLGAKEAMSCTVAVEEVIETHYKRQLDDFPKAGQHEHVHALIQNCYHDEVSHKNIAAEHNRKAAPSTPLAKTIKAGCKMAIWLSQRI